MKPFRYYKDPNYIAQLRERFINHFNECPDRPYVVARYIGISDKTLMAFVQNRRPPLVATLMKIDDYLDKKNL